MSGPPKWLAITTAALALVAAVWLARRDSGTPPFASNDAPASDPQRGELEGSVWTIEPDSSTILVSPRLFGLGGMRVLVTSETVVIVGDKEGGFGDLREGLRVRVAWEQRRESRLARSVEVVDAPGVSRLRRPSSPKGNGAPGPTAEGSSPAATAKPVPASTRARATPAEAAPAGDGASTRAADADSMDAFAVINWLLKQAP